MLFANIRPSSQPAGNKVVLACALVELLEPRAFAPINSAGSAKPSTWRRSRALRKR